MFCRTLPLCLSTLFCAATLVRGEFVQPELAPVDRLLKSAQTYLANHPAQADAHYTLARVHFLSFARGEATVPVVGDLVDGQKPVIADDAATSYDLYEARQRRAVELALEDIGERGPRPPAEKASAFEEARGKRARQLEAQDWHPRGDLPASEMIAHAAAALAEFREACRLEPRNGLYVLGMASLNEQVANWATTQHGLVLPPELKSLSVATARDSYLRAYRLAIGGDAGLASLPLGGLPSLVSHEAGTAYLRIVEPGRSKMKGPEKTVFEEVRNGVKKLKKLRVGAITPLVFSLHPTTTLQDLLEPRLKSSFDLRGYGVIQQWPWVKPETAFLVWDPEGRGHIDSARQLFGSYTFEMFWRTGYDALAVLDTDGNGRLTGDELRGVRAWFDTNGDGRSQPSEVHDLPDLGIVSIETHAPDHEDIHPTNARGIQLRDGRTLPTWDWITEPLTEPAGANAAARYSMIPTTAVKR